MHALALWLTLTVATTRQPAPKHIDIDDDEVVEGDLDRSQGGEIFARQTARYRSLLKLRSDFQAELLKTGERL